MLTREVIPGLPVAPLAMPALGAGPRRVARVDRDHRDPRRQRLVGDEPPQLEERPTLHARSVGSSGRCPGADPFEVLDPDGAPGVLSLLQDPLADDVVLVGPESGLPPA